MPTLAHYLRPALGTKIGSVHDEAPRKLKIIYPHRAPSRSVRRRRKLRASHHKPSGQILSKG
jgi:hypothetical protein